jgi:hypothetical protein
MSESSINNSNSEVWEKLREIEKSWREKPDLAQIRDQLVVAGLSEVQVAAAMYRFKLGLVVADALDEAERMGEALPEPRSR